MGGHHSGPCEATVPGYGKPVWRSVEGGSSSRVFIREVHSWLSRGYLCDRFENYCVCTLRKGTASA